MDAPANCQHLPWDSEFFGRRMARLSATALDAAAVAHALHWCAATRVDCLYLLVDAAARDTIRLAEQHGFELVDVRVTLAHPSGTAGEAAPADGPSIRPAVAADLPRLCAIARASHRDSRFYQDGRFAPEQCAALYETWITKSCQGGADIVLVPEIDGGAIGYVTCRQANASAGEIGLFAIAPDAQQRGVGRALVGAALGWFSAHNLRPVLVVTQGRNLRAQRLYQRSGFLTHTVELWYHRWFE